MRPIEVHLCTPTSDLLSDFISVDVSDLKSDFHEFIKPTGFFFEVGDLKKVIIGFKKGNPMTLKLTEGKFINLAETNTLLVYDSRSDFSKQYDTGNTFLICNESVINDILAMTRKTFNIDVAKGRFLLVREIF